MITRRTVLVLGAGASKPYGFPIASELKQLVLTPHQFVDDFAFRYSKSPHEAEQNFRKKLRYAQRSSVDAFLAHCSGDVLMHGKRLIAAHLAACESEATLFPQEGDWMRVLFDVMGRRADHDTFPSNALTIVTFNYDRSFEMKFFFHLRYQCHFTPDDAARIVSGWRIFHVQGSLGKPIFPEVQHQSGRPYKPNLALLDDVEKALSLPSSDPEANDCQQAARQSLAEAEHVIFLGFSFHELNCERLFSHLAGRKNSRWRASCYGMTGAERKSALTLVPLGESSPVPGCAVNTKRIVD